MSATRIYIARDSAARSVNADAVAMAIEQQARARGQIVEIVRTGSHGLLWLEPLVEVAGPQGRTAYGPVRVGDVVGLFEAGFLHGAPHPIKTGIVSRQSQPPITQSLIKPF